jgi:hypothetical protein
MLFKEINLFLHWESYETVEYTLRAKRGIVDC